MATKTALLDRRQAVKTLLSDRGDLLVVSGLGGAAYDVLAAGDHDLNFCLSGAMGGTAMMGLGLALAQPKRRVAVITGDGDLLMDLGALAVISAHRPANLAVVVVDNERYGETGNQVTHTARGVDLAGMAAAAGFPVTRTVTSMAELDEARRLMRASNGPVCLVLKVDPAPAPLFPRARDCVRNKVRFREALIGKP